MVIYTKEQQEMAPAVLQSWSLLGSRCLSREETGGLEMGPGAECYPLMGACAGLGSVALVLNAKFHEGRAGLVSLTAVACSM